MVDIILVTLVYNRKNYLTEALKSALGQTLDKSKWMHLIMDNASTDGAGEMAEQFYANNKESNVRFIKQPTNLGIQNGFNYVLNNFIPQYCPEVKIFSVLEADDRLTSDALEEVYKMFTEHPEIGESYSDFSSMDGNGKILHDVYPNRTPYVQNQFTEEGQRELRRLFGTIVAGGHQRSYSVKCLQEIGGFDPKYEYANDVEITARILEKYPVVKICKVLYCWRDHHNSASVHFRQKQVQQSTELQIMFPKRWAELKIL